MTDQEAHPPRIVVGVDGSDPSKAALRWAVQQAELVGGVVEPVLAWELPAAYFGVVAPAVSADDLEKGAARSLEQVIEDVVGRERPVPIRPRVAEGHPAAVLIRRAQGAQLLIVGNRGHGGFAEALLGSVSQYCVQHATCPVLVVRDGQR